MHTLAAAPSTAASIARALPVGEEKTVERGMIQARESGWFAPGRGRATNERKVNEVRSGLQKG